MMGRFIGRCTQCKGLLIAVSDKEDRKWARCTQCGAQYPLEQGHLIIGKQSDKAAGNSFTGMH